MIFHWLIAHLPLLLAFKGLMLAAAAPIADLGGGPPLVDTSVADTSTEPTEGDTGSDVEIDDTTAEGDSTATEEKDVTAKPDQVDWRTVPPAIKVHLQNIAKTDPTLANQLQNAVYTSQSFLKEIPGGIKEVRAIKASIEELGGLDAIKTVQQEYNQFITDQEVLDRKAAEGSPDALNTLVEVAGEGFTKMMPLALDKWLQKDPTNYEYVMSQVMVKSLHAGGVVNDLNMAFQMLNLKTPDALAVGIESLKRVAAWANGVNKKAIEAPKKPEVDPRIAEQQKSIDEEKTQIFNDKFSQQFGTWRNNEIKKEISAVLPTGKTLTNTQILTLGNWVVNEIKSTLTADPDYMAKLDKFYGARDLPELLKFAKSRTGKLLADTVKKGYRELFSTFGAAKPAAKPPVAGKPGTAKPGAPVAKPGVEGWTQVAADKAPRPEEIDNNKTDFKMKFNKQAILKTGKKVYWGDKVPA